MTDDPDSFTLRSSFTLTSHHSITRVGMLRDSVTKSISGAICGRSFLSWSEMRRYTSWDRPLVMDLVIGGWVGDDDDDGDDDGCGRGGNGGGGCVGLI